VSKSDETMTEWLPAAVPAEDMVAYRERTGMFRAVDVSRLLGDPRDCVSVQITVAPSFSLAAGFGSHR
jgi:hypothetical protein